MERLQAFQLAARADGFIEASEVATQSEVAPQGEKWVGDQENACPHGLMFFRANE
jgi:uncharacterized membrane protein YebE (DUF533 family)